MLLHITPRLLKPETIPVDCELVDLAVPELGLTLTGGRDVVARQPYPNRHYLVACRNVGRKAISGIFIETPSAIDEFTVIARWSIEKEVLTTHRVRYELIDRDFDAATDDMALWSATSKGLGGWRNRHPRFARDWTAIAHQPRMGVLMRDRELRQGDVADTVATTGLIKQRSETFRIPTVERERLLQPTALRERLPAIEHAFSIETPKPEAAGSDMHDTNDNDEDMRIEP